MKDTRVCDFFNYASILKIVFTYCMEQELPFKFIYDQSTLHQMFSKSFDYYSSGKFITIYPQSLESFKNVVQELNVLLKNEEGLNILTDTNYGDSQVIYYRYGAFIDNVKDQKTLGYFKSTKSKEDPFQKKFKAPKDFSIVAKNGRKYNFIGRIHLSNSGGIYKAYNSLGTYTIKEAKNHTGEIINDTFVPYKDFLMNEKKILEKLADTNLVPYTTKIVSSFELENSLFIVKEFASGLNASELKLKYGCDLVMKYDQRFYKWFIINLLEGINLFHQEKYFINDFSISDLIVEPLRHIRFIDLEMMQKMHPKAQNNLYVSSKPFYFVNKKRPENINDYKLLDIKKAGLTLLDLVASANVLYDVKNPNNLAWKRWLDYVCDISLVPKEVNNLIVTMLLNPQIILNFFNSRSKIKDIFLLGNRKTIAKEDTSLIEQGELLNRFEGFFTSLTVKFKTKIWAQLVFNLLFDSTWAPADESFYDLWIQEKMPFHAILHEILLQRRKISQDISFEKLNSFGHARHLFMENFAKAHKFYISKTRNGTLSVNLKDGNALFFLLILSLHNYLGLNFTFNAFYENFMQPVFNFLAPKSSIGQGLAGSMIATIILSRVVTSDKREYLENILQNMKTALRLHVVKNSDQELMAYDYTSAILKDKNIFSFGGILFALYFFENCV